MKSIIMLFLVILLINPAYSATWQRTYGGSGDECGNCVILDSEGYYVIAGYTTSFGAGGKDIWILKVDSLGDTVWTRTYGGGGDDEGVKILEYPDHNYIVVGNYQDENNDTLKYICLLKYDRDGNLLWDNISYQDSMYVNIRNFRLMENGNFLGCGFEGDYILNRKGYIVRLDSGGNIFWENSYQIGSIDFYSIDTTENNGFIVTSDWRVIKFDSSGDTLWSRDYDCFWYRTIINIGYGYVFVAHWDDGIMGPQYFIYEIDSLGNVISINKNSEISDEHVLLDLEVIDSAQYIGCGWYYGGCGAAYLVALYNSAVFDCYSEFYSLEFTHNREYIMTGLFYINGYELYLVKTDSTGAVGIQEDPPITVIDNSISVQWCNDRGYFNLSLPYQSKLALEIYDLSGRLVDTPFSGALSPGNHQIPFHSERSGIYFYRLESSYGTESGKFSIIR